MAGQETRLHAGTKQLTAFELWSGHGLTLVPAPPGRDWMQSTKGRAAMNCSANPGMGGLPPGRAGHRDALWHATCTGLEFWRGGRFSHRHRSDWVPEAATARYSRSLPM